MITAPRRSFTALAALVLAAGCAGTPGPVAPGSGVGFDFAKGYADAFEAEALDAQSIEPYLALVDRAAANPQAPGALEATLAALDELAGVSLPGFDGSGPTAALYRSRKAIGTAVTRLRAAWSAAGEAPPGASTALIRGSIASTLHELALYVGDTGAARVWGSKRGCVNVATVIGPLDWTPLRALADASPIAADKPLAATYPGIAPFTTELRPTPVHADTCQIDTNAVNAQLGVRAVVVDLAVPHPGTIHLALASSSAALVEVGGVNAIRRGFEAGGKQVTRFGSVTIPAAGNVRVVVRVAQKGDGGLIELDAWDDQGLPLAGVAPKPGAVAEVRAEKAQEIALTAPPGPSGVALAAAAQLAVGDTRAAEHLLELSSEGGPWKRDEKFDENGPHHDLYARPGDLRTPVTELLYARALEGSDDEPDNKISERVRGAVERAMATWPKAWEARIGHARVVERRRGTGEGATAALTDLGVVVPKNARPTAEQSKPWDVMVATYIAGSARRAALPDLAEAAYDTLAQKAPGAPLVAYLDARLHGRSGADAVTAACRGGLRKADTDCFEAHRDRGEFGEALAELDHLRRLRNAPDGLKDQELNMRILSGDRDGALAVYDSMSPGERRMQEALGFVAATKADAARSRVARDRLTAHDAPYALAPLVRALGLETDPAPRLEEEGRQLVLADRKHAFLPGAATAVLRHLERYGIDASGLVHYVLQDLRRVSGTTDVAQGANAFGPSIEGRMATRLLRKRIHKVDGRVLEPDAAANAQQASDLSQLETGDYVEVIVEGWVLPGDTGQLVIDTPDLLPERTSVREATIEIRRADKIPFSLWSHPLLGTPEERREGDYKVSVWHLKDQAPRRIEDGVPKMERGVSVSIGTQTWEQVARAMQETIRSFEDRDPYVKRWAVDLLREPLPQDKPEAQKKALIERVVAAVGKKVKVAGGGELSDIAAVYGGGAQHSTARTTLELGQGSRAWVIYRALLATDQFSPSDVHLAIAEAEPFSAVASFPPHVGRFRHPLVVVHLQGEDVWIDADVEGPPLPPGRISPELRGRTAMRDDGQMITVPGTGGETGDEVDVRLALDDKGDAKGSFAVLLHGRTAQGLAEAFETVVGTERREVLRAVVLGWLPWADVEDVNVSSTEGSWEIALRATIAVHGMGRPEGKDGKTWVLAGLEPVHFVYPRAAVGMLGATYASRGARENALSIESPLQYHMRRRIELPPGAKIVRAPANVEVTDANVTARRTQAVKGQTIEEDFSLSLPTGTVPASRYQGFVEKVVAIDDGFMAGTRIRVKP